MLQERGFVMAEPANTMTYADILAAAYRNLGQVNADADRQQQIAEQQYNTFLDSQKKAKETGVLKNREGASSRGVLDSSINLRGEEEVSQAVDKNTGAYLMSYNDQIAQLAQKRLFAQQQYDDANIQSQRASTTAGLTADSPGINSATGNPYNPADPYDWAGIDAAIKAGTAKNPDGTPYNPADPLNWAGIQAGMQAQQKAAARPTFMPKVTAPVIKKKTPTAATRTPTVTMKTKGPF